MARKYKNSMTFRFLTLLGLAVLASNAGAGVGTSLMQTAPVKETGQFESKFQADIIFNKGGGFNLSPHVVTGVIEKYVDVDAFVGAGTTDFQTGFLAKYYLFPDVDGQLGLSFLSGFSYIRDQKINAGLFNATVLTSKKINADFGDVTPYGAFQFETLWAKKDTVIPLTILLGAHWEATTMGPWSLYSEFSISVRKSLWALSLGAGYPF